MFHCGSKWFRVEYATSIYINNSININSDQMKIRKIINQIKEKLFMRNNYLNLTNNNKISSGENKIANKINTNINNKDRNKYGFPTIQN